MGVLIFIYKPKDMARTRRESTEVRYNMIHDVYDKVMEDLGDLRNYVSKSYIYDKIYEKTHLSIKTISYVLNHTRKSDMI